MLIDTGASRTVFDKTRIEKFASVQNLKASEKLSTGLETNSMQSHSVIINKLRIGDYTVEHYEAILLDLTLVNESYHKLGLPEIDGVLGSDILFECKAKIDYEKKALILQH